MALPYPTMDFVPFDILTAEELDHMVANDQALAAGTGLNDLAIATAKLAAKAATLAKMNGGATAGPLVTDASGNVTADYASTYYYDDLTTTFSNATTSDVAVTGLSITIVVPTGGASYKLEFYSPSVYNSGNNYNTVRFWDGAVGGTKVLELATYGSNGTALPAFAFRKITLTAGSHTINVSLAASAGTANILADTTGRLTSLMATRIA